MKTTSSVPKFTIKGDVPMPESGSQMEVILPMMLFLPGFHILILTSYSPFNLTAIIQQQLMKNSFQCACQSFFFKPCMVCIQLHDYAPSVRMDWSGHVLSLNPQYFPNTLKMCPNKRHSNICFPRIIYHNMITNYDAANVTTACL